MSSTATKPVHEQKARRIAHGEMRKLRAEMEDLQDYLDLIEARVRDEGKPTISLAEAERRIKMKSRQP